MPPSAARKTRHPGGDNVRVSDLSSLGGDQRPPPTVVFARAARAGAAAAVRAGAVRGKAAPRGVGASSGAKVLLLMLVCRAWAHGGSVFRGGHSRGGGSEGPARCQSLPRGRKRVRTAHLLTSLQRHFVFVPAASEGRAQSTACKCAPSPLTKDPSGGF